MLLGTGWCIASGAAGTFQTSRQSWLIYAQPPTPSPWIDAGYSGNACLPRRGPPALLIPEEAGH
jgi:hypothetical protein